MAHQECQSIWEWQDEVAHQLETWADRYYNECKDEDCNWLELCLNKVVCWVVHTVAIVVAWVIDVPAGWFLHTVCKIVMDLIDFVVSIAKGGILIARGIWDAGVGFVKGVFSGNWDQFRQGLSEIADGGLTIAGSWVFTVRDLISIALGGDTIAWIRERLNEAKLRDYVRKLLDSKYSGDPALRDKIASRINLDGGPFGMPISAKAIRTFVASDFRSSASGPPDLILWHEQPGKNLDLRALAGFGLSYTNHPRPELVANDGTSFDSSDLDEYISSRGSQGKPFKIFAMSVGTMQTKLDTATDKGRQLGLKISWSLEEVQAKQWEFVQVDDDNGSAAPDVLTNLGHRSPLTATDDLCVIVAVALFPYKNDGRNGKSACLGGSHCGLERDEVSGATFRDRVPDVAFKYVPIHEIGHCFGLCHVDGVDRIMYTPDPSQGSATLTWETLLQYFYLDGEPRFILAEAKSAWDYIMERFPASCLAGN